METRVPTASELIVEGFDEGGFRVEQALAVAMADASPELLSGCRAANAFLESIPVSSTWDAPIEQLRVAADVSRAIK